MYSSGTTGRPKGVALTQKNVLAHTFNAFADWELEPGDKNMVAMPLFHVAGSCYAQYGVQEGHPIVMTRDVDGASLAGGDHARRQPNIPGSGRAGEGAPVGR